MIELSQRKITNKANYTLIIDIYTLVCHFYLYVSLQELGVRRRQCIETNLKTKDKY